MTDLLREVYEDCVAQAKKPDRRDAQPREAHLRRLHRARRSPPRRPSSSTPTKSGWKGELVLVFQKIASLHKACPTSRGDWYFTGDYPTPGGLRRAQPAPTSTTGKSAKVALLLIRRRAGTAPCAPGRPPRRRPTSPSSGRQVDARALRRRSSSKNASLPVCLMKRSRLRAGERARRGSAGPRGRPGASCAGRAPWAGTSGQSLTRRCRRPACRPASAAAVPTSGPGTALPKAAMSLGGLAPTG